MSDTESNGSGDYGSALSDEGPEAFINQMIIDTKDMSEGNIVGDLKFHNRNTGELDLKVTLDLMCQQIAHLTKGLATVGQYALEEIHNARNDIEDQAQQSSKLQKQIDWLAFDKRKHPGKKGKGKAKSKP